MMGISGIADDTAYPPIDGLHPPIPLGRMGEKIGKGFNKLDGIGGHLIVLSLPSYKGRDKCINLGPCNTGCSQGAKSSADIKMALCIKKWCNGNRFAELGDHYEQSGKSNWGYIL